jgi:pimeloyl-ACP methyl ester carboxylesterase
VLSSSYLGFGHGTLHRDASEIDQLFQYLVCHRGAERLCVVGHSTGCQNAVHYLANGDPALVARLILVVLQAPVSDREHAMFEDPERYKTNLALAEQLREQNKEDEMMPRSAFWAPITARRFLDLHGRGGSDDYFSSDYTDDELQQRLWHVGRRMSRETEETSSSPPPSLLFSSSSSSSAASSPFSIFRRKVLVAFSGSDEYVPSHVDSKALASRLVDAMNAGCLRTTKTSAKSSNDGGLPEGTTTDVTNVPSVADVLYLPTANHTLSEGPGDLEAFVGRVEELLGQALSE